MIRKEPGATEALTAVEAKLATTREAHRIASDAIVAMGQEQAAAEVAHAAEQRAGLEADRADRQAALSEALSDFNAMLSDLVASVKAALAVSDEAHNAGVALGIHGDPTGTSRALEGRIHHALRVDAGLAGFDFALNPALRHPLGTDLSKLRDPIPPQAEPLPERRDIKAERGYAGQNMTSRPTVQTELKDAEGNWIEVPIGAFEFPTGEPVEIVLDDDLAALRAEATRRSNKRRTARSA